MVLKTSTNKLITDIVSQDDFLATYRKPGMGQAALVTLNRFNVFPVSINSPTFSLLHAIGLYTTFSGTLWVSHGDEDRILNAKASISEPTKTCLELMTRVDEYLGLKTKKVEKADQLAFGENGSPYSRLLYLMGFHASCHDVSDRNRETKSSTKLHFPKYMTFLIQNYDSLKQVNQRKARNLMRDLVAILFDTRSAHNSREFRKVNLVSQPSRRNLLSEAQFISDAMDIAYPEAKMDLMNSFKFSRNDNREYKQSAGYFYLTHESLERLSRQERSPVAKVYSNTPSLSANLTNGLK